jgi:hypothetical protein
MTNGKWYAEKNTTIIGKDRYATDKELYRKWLHEGKIVFGKDPEFLSLSSTETFSNLRVEFRDSDGNILKLPINDKGREVTMLTEAYVTKYKKDLANYGQRLYKLEFPYHNSYVPTGGAYIN